MKLKQLTEAVLGCLAIQTAWAEAPAPVTISAPVVVTATRVEQNSFDLPVSIDVVDAEKIQDGQLQANVSESLARVPGIVAQFRGHSAQDIQISTRGFGARSAFGVRGIRLYADGIPLTMPDGQGQAGTFDLGSAKRIEVMRGPFSALYGNSSGGVVQIFTANGPKVPTVEGSFTAGSYGTRREAIKIGGSLGSLDALTNFSHLESDGYRDHSAVRRDLFNAKAEVQINPYSKLTLIGTYMDQPLGQDPQGLSASQFAQDPKQVATKVNTFNSRVERSHSQVGAKLEHAFDEDNQLNLMAYVGQRDNLQFQSTGANVLSSTAPTKRANGAANSTLATGTALTLNNPKNSYYYVSGTQNGNAGGVVQIDREFWGTDLRFSHKGMFGERPYNLTVGTNFDTMTDARTGFDNFLFDRGTTPTNDTNKRTYLCGVEVTCGVQGLLRRDEDEITWNFDQYAQAEWSPLDRLNLVAGVRHSDVHVRFEDHFIKAGANGDGSGSVSFAKTTPVVGVVFKATPAINLYANAGKGFETPSLVEVAYLPGGSGGFNRDLKPATSNNYEIGAKMFVLESTRATLALFKTDTNNEIVVADNTNGRSSYQNAGGTERRGYELTLDSELGYGFTGFASYAFLNARYSDAFCSGAIQPTQALCGASNWVSAGKPIPGAYRRTAYAELAWKYAPIGFSTALETHGVSKVYVSDKSTEAANGYALMNWRGGFSQEVSNWKFTEFARVENIFDRKYVSSVKVNDSSSQFYEPGSNRNWLLGINANYHF